MAFQNAYDVPIIEDSTLRGKRIPIAVMTWTSTNCKMIPLMFKIQDDQGIVHAVKPITVCFSEKKKHFSQWCWIFYCRSTNQYCPEEFRMIYYTEDLKWEMII